ncbi:MAG TPA: 2,3-diaminopropionate biosynthesis protein SbnB [Pseudonocardiaceae bacterium]
MSELAPPAGLRVIGCNEVAEQIEADRPAVVAAVREAYLAHGAGQTTNPHSSFLRFPDRPRDRIIALPAFLGGDKPRSGIKWIASYPGNVEHGFPRASAVLVLNDYETGYPVALLESSIISASRTAGSAVLGAESLLGGRSVGSVGFIGNGLIAGHVWLFLRDLGWEIDEFRLFDAKPANAERFGERITAQARPGTNPKINVVDSAADAFGADLVILATVAGEPHIFDPAVLAHAPVVLHLSLRDLAPELILAATNITDDIDHAVRERTSLHLTEQRVGDRSFVHGTIADVLRGDLVRDPSRAAIFAPFGLGVLDIAVGGWVYERVCEAGGGTVVNGFFDGVAR